MRAEKLLLLLLLLSFWAISLYHLDTVPPVYEDEPWQASTGWKLATEGIFGSDLFAGFYGMERHYYGYMPLHPFLLAVIFRLAGLGLFQARFEPVVLGLLALALTYSLGRRLFTPAVGLLALFLLLVTRTTGLTPSQYSGILFIDIPRISRYDALVPVFGLTALHAWWTAAGAGSRYALWRYGTAGLLAALAGLSHLYGVFWFAALLLLALWQRPGRRAFLALCAGFLLPWLPYLAYVLQAPADWAGQTRDYAPRFQLLDLRWYGQNLLNEARRYGPGLGSPGLGWLLRPGFWAFIVVTPLALLALGRQALYGGRAGVTLFIPAVTLPLLFALLIYLKLANYLLTVFPLLALVVAWSAWQLWQRATLPGRSLLRPVLLLLLLAVTAEGVWRISRLPAVAAQTTPHDEYMAQLRVHVPAGARVLGLHNYWLGFTDYEYRSWAVPLLKISPTYWSPPLTLAAALNEVDPQAVLLDSRMTLYFAERPAVAAKFEAWLAGRGFTLAATVDDPTYGRMVIYLLPAVAGKMPAVHLSGER